MGLRGPTRNPNSRRGQAESRKRQKLVTPPPSKAKPVAVESPLECPSVLPEALQGAWSGLIADAIAAGVAVKQFDARGFVVAAGQEVDLYYLESCVGGDTPLEQRLAVIGRKEQVRKSFLASLVAIGGTPLARLRARIAPEEKPKDGDEWSRF